MNVRTGTAKSGDLDIFYEDMGDVNDPAVLLIMGLGAQLLFWRKGFCERLVNQGLRVIRYDNRDVGLSSKIEGGHTGAKMLPRLARAYLGKRSDAVYTLENMADDAAALLDHLDIEKAHVVGGSMGGMIAQIVAARYQHRTKTLAVIFSSNNQALLPPPGPKQLLAVTTRPKDTSREGIIANSVAVSRIIGSPAYQAPEEQVRADAVEGYERSYYPAGVARHFSAIMGSGSLVAYDKLITAPTVVIHGSADKLMRPSGGRAVAKSIRRARFVLFDGMGHDLPEPLWDDIVGELKTTFAEVP
ncbi:alpha/beta hydrolase [Mycolicibacterium sp. P9-64]|uniref:alpha/beta fold hydrolase n=1 Tax=Mycolicibacterium sp. P9-64 TaxID=2024612 RepID=UPI0011EE6C2B|nr:alpha/beta hydrolase [Mycolicibacterium sp. P9-64]KAA0079237.1 alpha/beta hydrolase [Mycolicibacterium sp. P9-64]